MNWIACADRLPDEGVVVMTKIDDANGCRNEQPLKRQGRLWYQPDGSMYIVYYTPTHWAVTAGAARVLGDGMKDKLDKIGQFLKEGGGFHVYGPGFEAHHVIVRVVSPPASTGQQQHKTRIFPSDEEMLPVFAESVADMTIWQLCELIDQLRAEFPNGWDRDPRFIGLPGNG